VKALEKPYSGEPWSIAGKYCEICNCKVSCPCNFLSEPTEGFCQSVMCFEVRQGSFGGEELQGTRVAMAIRSPGRMQLGGWKAGFYIDEGATPSKRTALETIFTGKAGGPMKVICTRISEPLGVRYVPIRTVFDGEKRSVEIPGVLNAAAEPLEGNRGGKVILENPPATFWLPSRLTQVKSQYYRFHDFGMGGSWEGRHFLYSNFDWNGP
jgi:hypothetical protein